MGKLLDEFTKGFGDAVADIREKVVEEPWYGRAVTDSGVPQWPATKEPEPGGDFGSRTLEREIASDMDIDR